MAKPKDKDRRAVVEQMRREQQRSEKRRTRLIIAACAVVALAIGIGTTTGLFAFMRAGFASTAPSRTRYSCARP